MRIRRSVMIFASLSSALACTNSEASTSNESASVRPVFEQRHPLAQFVESGDRIVRIYGAPLSQGDSALQSAKGFVVRDFDVFGVNPEDLHSERFDGASLNIQPVLFDPATGDYRFMLVYYRQYLGEWPVYGADLRLLVRNESNNPLVLAASALRNLGGFQIDDATKAALEDKTAHSKRFDAAKVAVQAKHPNLINFTAPEIQVWAGMDDMVVDPRLAFVFEADDANGGSAPNEHMLFLCDVSNGVVLHSETRILQADIVGSVSGFASELPGSEQCEDEIPTALPYVAVSAGATTAYADEQGQFSLPGLAAGPIEVSSSPSGQWFTMLDASGPVELLTVQVSAPGMTNFLHNAANTEFTRAQVNAYISANVVRDFSVGVNPAYPRLDEGGFPITVNRFDGVCPRNAWYNITPEGQGSINFCRAGAGYPNTAFSSVVYHEFGHHLVQMAGSGQGQYGEGMSDVVAMLILDSPVVGVGLNGSCSGFLRTAEAGIQYPCSGEIHDCGRLISGCVWDTRNALIATEPVAYLEILSSLAINSILLHQGTQITPAIAIDFLTLDDDDAEINNGTPHCSAICKGFGMHSMSNCTTLGTVQLDLSNGFSPIITPDSTELAEVTVTADVAVEVTAYYRINGMGTYSAQALFETAPNVFSFPLPLANCGDLIEYFFVARGGCLDATLPQLGGVSPYRTRVLESQVSQVLLNFESDPAWTVTTSATDGGWTRGIPVNCNRGDPPADADSSGQCWLTDNDPANCNSDVDGGATTLTSSIYDLSGLSNPFVRYLRWFSTSTGPAPQTDRFMVEISTTAGSTWNPLETVGPTASSPISDIFGGWKEVVYPVPVTSQFRIRFIVEDINGSSIVEAGVDDFEILDGQCASNCPGSPTGDMNNDTLLDGQDVSAFVTAILNGPTAAQLCAGDFSNNQNLDTGDLQAFVNELLQH